jgi:hypothetical protein
MIRKPTCFMLHPAKTYASEVVWLASCKAERWNAANPPTKHIESPPTVSPCCHNADTERPASNKDHSLNLHNPAPLRLNLRVKTRRQPQSTTHTSQWVLESRKFAPLLETHTSERCKGRRERQAEGNAEGAEAGSGQGRGQALK